MKNGIPLSREAELDLWKEMESAETLLFDKLFGFGFIAEEYVALAKRLLNDEEGFDHVVYYDREDLSFKSRYMAALPELVRAVEKVHLDYASEDTLSPSERSEDQYVPRELFNAFQFQRAIKMEFVASAISYRDAISRVSPEEEVKITQSLRMPVNRFRRDCEKLEELDRKIEANREKLIEANTDVVWREVKNILILVCRRKNYSEPG